MKVIIEFFNGLGGYDFQEYILFPFNTTLKQISEFCSAALKKYADATFFAAEERTWEEHFESCNYRLTFVDDDLEDEGFIPFETLEPNI